MDWIAYELNHFYGPWKRTVYVVHTDAGLIGLGESGSPEPEETIEKYIGTSPFDWVGDENSLGLGTAMYDLMGKAAGVPVYKLFGQRYRRWVPVASWTVSTHPKRMAQAVERFSAMGYTWMKYHLSPFENVMDQMDAMQAVAPEGFRIHHDITMHGHQRPHVRAAGEDLEIPHRRLFRGSSAGTGHRRLRRAAQALPAADHLPPHPAGSHLRSAEGGRADAYMLGHQKIGAARRRAGLFAAANIPFMLQNVGGNITRSMTAHMQSAFKTASFHFVNTSESKKSDVVHERIDPVNGFVRVPEQPGLGVTLDRAELERLEKLQLPEQDKWIIKTRFANGTRMYNIHDPEQSLFMVRPDRWRLIPMSYDSPLTTEYWDDDGSEEYRKMFARIEKEGIVLLKP